MIEMKGFLRPVCFVLCLVMVSACARNVEITPAEFVLRYANCVKLVSENANGTVAVEMAPSRGPLVGLPCSEGFYTQIVDDDFLVICLDSSCSTFRAYPFSRIVFLRGPVPDEDAP
jgi:hypothetical protein